MGSPLVEEKYQEEKACDSGSGSSSSGGGGGSSNAKENREYKPFWLFFWNSMKIGWHALRNKIWKGLRIKWLGR